MEKNIGFSPNMYGNNFNEMAIQTVVSLPSTGTYKNQVVRYNDDTYIRNDANSAWVKLLKEGDVDANAVTRSADATVANELVVSGGSDKTVQTYGGAAGLLKVNGSGVVSTATAGTDYITASGSVTLTNKTINASNNTISNLTFSMLASGEVETDLSSSASSSKFVSAAAAKSYTDSKIAALGALVGSFDASGGSFPTTGTGASSAIVKGNYWYVSVAGTVSGIVLAVGDMLVAKTDGASTSSDFFAIEANRDAATTSAAGLVELATQSEAEGRSDTSRALTAASVQDFRVRKSFTITGDGSTTQFTVTHNLGVARTACEFGFVDANGLRWAVDDQDAATDTSNKVKIVISPALPDASVNTLYITY